MLAPEHIYHELQQLSSSRSFVVAYSGGVDSHVLLHALAQIQQRHEEIALRAVHINHQLQPDADHWQQHCQLVCQHLEVPFEAFNVTVSCHTGSSVEAQAREARYRQLAACLQGDECLLTAHHQDDQAETVLLQLFRGAGVKGLAAMAASRSLLGTCLLRPMLHYRRIDIEEYAQQQQLQWVEDDSNQDTSLDRNFVRHQVLPVIQQHWPEAAKTLSRVAKHCAAADLLLSEYAADDLTPLSRDDNQLELAGLLRLSVVRQRHILREWLQRNGCTLPDTHQLEAMFNVVVAAKADAEPCFHWKGWQLRRFGGFLYVMPKLSSHDSSVVIAWDLCSDLLLAELGVTLSCHNAQIRQLAECVDTTQITVRFRQGGEQIRLYGQQHSKTLKQLLQQWQVPPWLRDRVPLIFVKEELVCVLGYGSTIAVASKMGC